MAASCHSNSRRSLVGCGGGAVMPAGARWTIQQKAVLAGETPPCSGSPPYAGLSLVLPSSSGGPVLLMRANAGVILPDSCLHDKEQLCQDKRHALLRVSPNHEPKVPNRFKSRSLLTIPRTRGSEAGSLWGRGCRSSFISLNRDSILPGLCCFGEQREKQAKE